MKSRSLLPMALSASFLALSLSAQAHSPFIAPQAYIVDGKTITVIGGLAETPFSSEHALSGYKLTVVGPAGETQSPEQKNSKALTVADVETKDPGTYKVLASRDNAMEFVQVSDRWLRVVETKRTDLPPLAERPFITPAEITPAMKRVKSVRHEQLVSFFSRDKTSEGVLKGEPKGLYVRFQQHPNTLKAAQPVTLVVTFDGKVQQGFNVAASRQLATAGEESEKIKQTSDAQGQVKLQLPVAGQYLIEVSSPEGPAKAEPQPVTYRQNIAVQVH